MANTALFITNILNACDSVHEIETELKKPINFLNLPAKRRLKKNKEKIIKNINYIKTITFTSIWIDDLILSLYANKFRIRDLLKEYCIVLDASETNNIPWSINYISDTDIISVSVSNSNIIMHIQKTNGSKNSITAADEESKEQKEYFDTLRSKINDLLIDYLNKK